jgi:uncharacterized membrane protein
MLRAVLNWLSTAFDAVRTNLWFLPTLMFLLGIALALGMLHLDGDPRWSQSEVRNWVSSGSGDDARNLLSTLLTAVITMAGIVFSVTVVSLSLAANAYGPRLIRTFRAQRGTQIALGAFVLTIVYLLLVLRAVRGDAPAGQAPDLAVAVGGALALACVLALLGFIQGVSSIIVADEVVRRVRLEFDHAAAALPARGAAPAASDLALPDDFDDRAARLRLPREGYVQSVAFEALAAWAQQRDLVLRLDFRPGDFVVDGDRKVLVYPAPDDPERARRQIDRFIVTGEQRTPTQDIEFAVRHLVEIAVRALSPGINDPFTAMAVIDRIRGALARIARHRMPAAHMADEAGALRIVRRVSDFDGVLRASLDQIRQAGAGKPAVMIHMLRALGALAGHLQDERQRAAVERYVRSVKAAALDQPLEQGDREDVLQAYEEAMAALGGARP